MIHCTDGSVIIEPKDFQDICNLYKKKFLTENQAKTAVQDLLSKASEVNPYTIETLHAQGFVSLEEAQKLAVSYLAKQGLTTSI